MLLLQSVLEATPWISSRGTPDPHSWHFSSSTSATRHSKIPQYTLIHRIPTIDSPSFSLQLQQLMFHLQCTSCNDDYCPLQSSFHSTALRMHPHLTFSITNWVIANTFWANGAWALIAVFCYTRLVWTSHYYSLSHIYFLSPFSSKPFSLLLACLSTCPLILQSKPGHLHITTPKVHQFWTLLIIFPVL